MSFADGAAFAAAGFSVISLVFGRLQRRQADRVLARARRVQQDASLELALMETVDNDGGPRWD